jgi:small ligand-binding sensory domain FIST
MSADQAAFAFASALSTRTTVHEALDEVCGQLSSQLRGTPDLVLAFFSAEHVPNAEKLSAELCQRLATSHLIGCSGESIVGTNCEIEGQPALSVWAARLPGVAVLPMHLQFQRTPEGGGIVGWPDDLPTDWPEGSALLAVADPFSFPAEALLELINEEHPGVPVVGGMASTGSQPGENRLLFSGKSVDQGAAVVLLHGPIRVRTLVSQGCRPIGQPFVITRAERNVMYQLGGAPAYQRLVEVFQTLATSEQEQVRRGLHVGRVVTEYRDHFEQGDFLVRNVIGMDANEGAIAIGDYVRAGQTVQFHVRDWETADGELRQLLSATKKQMGEQPRGALLFTCNGRGTRLFPEPNHDAGAIAQLWGEIPVAGFFAAGELGPIGGSNFMHGFTASVAVIEPKA